MTGPSGPLGEIHWKDKFHCVSFHIGFMAGHFFFCHSCCTIDSKAISVRKGTPTDWSVNHKKIKDMHRFYFFLQEKITFNEHYLCHDSVKDASVLILTGPSMYSQDVYLKCLVRSNFWSVFFRIDLL